LTAASLTIVCTTSGDPLPAGLQKIVFPPASFIIGPSFAVQSTFINICTSQDFGNIGDSFSDDIIVSRDSTFRFELLNSCGASKFRSHDDSCSSGDHTFCDFTIPTGLSYAEFSLIFFADAVSNGCFFRILSLDSYLRASSYPVISVYNQTDSMNAFEMKTHPTSLFILSNPPTSVNIGQDFQTQG
jgi:hypothetical protein